MNAVKAVIDGQGQLDYGLCWYPQTGPSASGLGLLTNGFLWLKNDIWSLDLFPVDPVWVECECGPACE